MSTEGRSRGDKNLIFQWREGDRQRRERMAFCFGWILGFKQSNVF
jgi:hypothetical protein